MRSTVGLFGLVLLAASEVAAVDITSCQQRVPPHAAATLQADLTCPDAGFCQQGSGVGTQPCTQSTDCGVGSACIKFAILLEHRARLNLNGHVLTGPFTGSPAGDAGVYCLDGACTVKGPGEINSFSLGINLGGSRRALVHDATLRHNFYGVHLGSQRLRNLTLRENVYGAFFGEAVVSHVDASANQESGLVGTGQLRGTDITTNGNGEAGVIVIGPFALNRLTATGNLGPGLAADSAGRLRNSTVTGNNGGAAGFDILADPAPTLSNTVCGLSAALIIVPGPFADEFELEAGASLGICAGD